MRKGRHVYTFTKDDMKSGNWLRIEGRLRSLSEFFGPVGQRDVGKRVYAVPTADGTGEILQAESDAQFRARLQSPPMMNLKPTDEELDNRFRYHPPKDAEQIKAHERVTEATLALAKELRDLCPAGRNLSLALSSLEDVRMRANAALACGQ